jgi:exopolyphosphatase / guanosine-5'-triphosphate,3'-diphosphate pyrophosphatase
MSVGAVDIGTNSARLLITDAKGREIVREMHITRLGQGVDVTGALHEDAIARTVSVLADYGALLRKHGVTRIRATATSAARDASNREVFFAAAKAALGVVPELLPGEEEALLSFRGATQGLDLTLGPFLIVDIGGGSTEFVLGQTEPDALISVDMGCVRMTERHLASDPASPAQIEACLQDVKQVLQRVAAQIPVQRARRMIGLAGTITTLGAMAKGLKYYDPTQTHGMTLTRSEVQGLFEQLARADLATRRTILPDPKRADVIVGGAAVLLGILREFEIAQLTVSESDILDGLAASLRS